MVDRSKEKDNSLVCFVSTSESVEIPASCQMRLAATISGQSWPVSEIGIVEPLAKFMNEYGPLHLTCNFRAHNDSVRFLPHPQPRLWSVRK